MTNCSVVICIPTFRRPKGLEQCLRAISSLNGNTAFRVIVGENDPSRREGQALCERMQGEISFPLTSILVEKQGIAQNRNAIIAEALKDQSVDFIAMVDDDEWPQPQWLEDLLLVADQYRVDVVGGPVARIFETPTPTYLATANLADFEKMQTGVVDWVDATSNILFRASVFRERDRPWFDPSFDLLGGEDTDFLLGLRMEGGKFAWAHEAVVYEDMPLSRSTVKWALLRAFRIGNSYALVNKKRRPPEFRVLPEVCKMAATLLLSLGCMVVFCWHPALRFKGMRLGARVLGKAVGFMGSKYKEYAVVHGA
jgi:succinoglycan biosynthesis protein ExoM